MRRGTPLRSRLGRIALAYLLAVQAVLGAWVTHTASASTSIDASLTLCRTVAGDDAQQSGDDAPRRPHCAAMCLSGVCGAGDPPAAATTEVEFPIVRQTAVAIPIGRADLRASALHVSLNARGPPSIA